ncbi:hypothetical protein AB3S75_000514 [Citrus x aurantiifolia]
MDHLLELLKSNSLSSTACGALAQTGPELGEDDWQC